MLAHIADIPQLKKAFDEGLDIHAMTASEMFGVPVKDMPAEVRRRAKAINFGIIYGISAFGLANQLGISKRGGRRVHQDLLRALPRHPRLHGRQPRSCAHEHGYVETIFGRRIHYPEINTKNPSMRGFLERAAINAPIQGSAADIIRRAMIRMPAALDEARLEVGAHAAAGARRTGVRGQARTRSTRPCKIITRVMEKAAEPAVQLKVPIQVDAKAADNWEAAH